MRLFIPPLLRRTPRPVSRDGGRAVRGGRGTLHIIVSGISGFGCGCGYNSPSYSQVITQLSPADAGTGCGSRNPGDEPEDVPGSKQVCLSSRRVRQRAAITLTSVVVEDVRPVAFVPQLVTLWVVPAASGAVVLSRCITGRLIWTTIMWLVLPAVTMSPSGVLETIVVGKGSPTLLWYTPPTCRSGTCQSMNWTFEMSMRQDPLNQPPQAIRLPLTMSPGRLP
jgi:hypothetical protein